MDRLRDATRPLAVDLFAGCGGLTAGLKRAGFNVKLAVEVDQSAAASYRLNHPRTTLVVADIRSFDPVSALADLGIGRGRLDLLAACPPCQGFSTIRTLNDGRRVNDPRNNLVDLVGTIVDEVRPRTLLFENVAGLGRQARFLRLVTRLRRMGYHCSWEIVDAAFFGVPQHRKRLILLASRLGKICLPRRSKRLRTVFEAIGKLPEAGGCGDWLHDIPEKRSRRVREVIEAVPRDGGSRSALPPNLVLECHKNTDGFKDVYGRLSWHEPAGTITSGCTNPSKGRFLHPDQNRALTLREAALLQSFPVRYRFARTSKTDIATQIGNAIPPTFATRQALELRRHLSRNQGQ